MLFNFFKKKETLQTPDMYYQKLINIEETNKYGFMKVYANQENTLYKIYGNARTLNGNINILVISDTHNTLD